MAQTKASLNYSLYSQEWRNLVFARLKKRHNAIGRDAETYVSCQNTHREENGTGETHELWNYRNVSPLA